MSTYIFRHVFLRDFLYLSFLSIYSFFLLNKAWLDLTCESHNSNAKSQKESQNESCQSNQSSKTRKCPFTFLAIHFVIANYKLKLQRESRKFVYNLTKWKVETLFTITSKYKMWACNMNFFIIFWLKYQLVVG